MAHSVLFIPRNRTAAESREAGLTPGGSSGTDGRVKEGTI